MGLNRLKATQEQIRTSWFLVNRSLLLVRTALILVGAVALGHMAAVAQWQTQKITLKPGWNAVYLHVDASHETLTTSPPPAPIDQIWLWNRISSGDRFVTDPATQSTNQDWASWLDSDSDLESEWLPPGSDTLEHLIGNAAYLVHNNTAEDYEWSIKGKPLPPTVASYGWTSRGVNLIGFSFTGWVIERFEEGDVRSRSSVIEGLLEGWSEGYYPDGQLQVREHFRKNISHGRRTKFYEEGQVLSVTTIKDGQHHGVFSRWHDNGQLAEAVRMVEGQPHGASVAYYASGCLSAQAELSAGEVITRQEWRDGECCPNKEGGL